MKSLNEGIFSSAKKAKNIVGTVNTVLNGDDKDASSSNYLGGSVSQYSKNLVMTFPVLCDNTLSPETASMISKANERNVTTMLMLLFSAMNIEANNGMKVLSQVHKNISTSMDVYEVIDKMNDMSDRAVKVAYETVKGTYGRESEAITEMVEELKNGNQKSYPVNSFAETSLNRFSVQRQYNRLVVKEANSNLSKNQIDEISAKVAAQIGIIAANTGDKLRSADKTEVVNYLNSADFVDKINDIIDTLDLNVEITDKQRDEIINAAKIKYAEELGVRQDELKNLSLYRDTEVKLVDTDVKKANELQPTVLQVNYTQKKDNGDVELRSFLAGVKSRLVAVSSTDIVERLIAKNKTRVNFLNFIRATTGEIGFFKDFLFAIDQAKLDSKNAVKKGEAAAIWNCLANRAAKNNSNKLKKLGNDASAITILAISQETVNYMKSVHKFDLESMNNTKMICDAYNLMGIMIADDSIEAIKTYYVGNNGYETLAYSYMEKENKNSDYKKMINLMGKMNTR
jgi:hypothetical protein